MENISQGSCRDLLADAMVKLDGLRIVMHVHDELVIEEGEGFAEGALRDMLEVMSSPPKWADGFPLSCEGYTSQHYVKSPLPGEFHGAATLGEIHKLETVKEDSKKTAKPEGFNSVVYGPTRFDPRAVLPESPEEWPYWAEGEPDEVEESDLLAGINSVDDVYRVAARYGISAEVLRRLAQAEYKAEDDFIAARRRLWRHLRSVIPIPANSPFFAEVDDYASPRLARLGVHWDLIVAHLLSTNDVYAEAFPFRDSDNPNDTVIEGDAATWLWGFYRQGEPKKPPRKDRLEKLLRSLLDRRREIKQQEANIPF